jgi:hypothetical protein
MKSALKVKEKYVLLAYPLFGGGYQATESKDQYDFNLHLATIPKETVQFLRVKHKSNCTKRLLVNFKPSLLLRIIHKCRIHFNYLQPYLYLILTIY